MKAFIEKPSLTGNISFLAKTYRTPEFEIPWHKHIEHEIIYFTEGEGLIFMGNYVGDFKPGDVFFIGSNLPHTFQKANADLIVNAVVIQFREEIWGTTFFDLPECKLIVHFLHKSLGGIKISPSVAKTLQTPLQELEHQTGFERMLNLFNCLHILSSTKQRNILSTQTKLEFNPKNKERIDNVFQYTIDNFQESITLNEIATYADMSVPAFCNYFKKCAKKPYVVFLNEVRVGFASTQLIDTQKSIESICFESGFNTLVNFNRQFKKVKKMSPSLFRKTFRNSE